MRSTLTGLFLGSLTTLAWAGPTLPTGPAVVAGSATVTPAGSRVDIVQTTDRAIINWTAFSIGAGGTVQFVQPSAASAALNRVTGGEASLISGLLTANGQVFLVNPNGITVGAGGRIDAAGLTLSTANIADGDFMAGNLRYETAPAGSGINVEAGGSLTAPTMSLEAGTVNIQGSVADRGSISFGGGGVFTFGSGGPVTIPSRVDIPRPPPVLSGGTLPGVTSNPGGSLSIGTGFRPPPFVPPAGGSLVVSPGATLAATNLGSALPPAPAVTMGAAPAPAPGPGNASASGHQSAPPARPAGDGGNLAAGSVTIRIPLVGGGNIALN